MAYINIMSLIFLNQTESAYFPIRFKIVLRSKLCIARGTTFSRHVSFIPRHKETMQVAPSGGQISSQMASRLESSDEKKG